MKPLLSGFVFVCICFSACKKDNLQTSQEVYLKATVAATSDISCGYPALDFSEDSLAIREMIKENWNTAVVLDLPSPFNIHNKKLYAVVRSLKPEEEFPCLAIGIWYPHLKILEVKER